MADFTTQELTLIKEALKSYELKLLKYAREEQKASSYTNVKNGPMVELCSLATSLLAKIDQLVSGSSPGKKPK